MGRKVVLDGRYIYNQINDIMREIEKYEQGIVEVEEESISRELMSNILSELKDLLESKMNQEYQMINNRGNE